MLRRTLFKGIIGILGMIAIPYTANAVISSIKPEESDIVKWAESNIWIHGLNSPIGGEKIKLLPIQKHILNSWMNNYFNLTVSCRQSGKSTMAMIHALYTCIHTPNHQYTLLDIKGDMAKYTMERILYTFKKLPQYGDLVNTITRDTIVFTNGSSIVCDYLSHNSVMGRTIDTLNLQEFDFSRNQTDFINCIFPCMKSIPNAKMIIASTLSDIPETNFKKTMNTDKLNSVWNVEKIHYLDVPYMANRIETIKTFLTKEEFNREYCNII